MTFHQMMVSYTGSIYLLIGLTILVAWKVLGPRYADRLTIGSKYRAVVFVAGVMAIVQGLVIVFPGKLVHPECMSPVRPVWATILLLAIAMTTELIASKWAPPPVLERLQAAFKIMTTHHDADLSQAAMLLPTAAFGEVPPADPPPIKFSSPRLRRWVLAVCVLGLIVIFALFVHASAAPLSR